MSPAAALLKLCPLLATWLATQLAAVRAQTGWLLTQRLVLQAACWHACALVQQQHCTSGEQGLGDLRSAAASWPCLHSWRRSAADCLTLPAGLLLNRWQIQVQLPEQAAAVQGEADAMRESMEDLLYQHGVDMVFAGVLLLRFCCALCLALLTVHLLRCTFQAPAP